MIIRLVLMIIKLTWHYAKAGTYAKKLNGVRQKAGTYIKKLNDVRQKAGTYTKKLNNVRQKAGTYTKKLNDVRQKAGTYIKKLNNANLKLKVDVNNLNNAKLKAEINVKSDRYCSIFCKLKQILKKSEIKRGGFLFFVIFVKCLKTILDDYKRLYTFVVGFIKHYQ